MDAKPCQLPKISRFAFLGRYRKGWSILGFRLLRYSAFLLGDEKGLFFANPNRRLDQICRPCLDLLVYLGYILADDAKANHDETANE